jgi:hypothetical protein
MLYFVLIDRPDFLYRIAGRGARLESSAGVLGMDVESAYGGAEVLGEAAAELAAAGGTALVTAMVTDGWESFKARFARLLGRGNAGETEAVGVRLDESHAMLLGLAGADLERARGEQQLAWRVRLADALERHPGAENELRSLVAEVQTQTRIPPVSIQQNVTSFDHAQQAVQGQGRQVNTFGSQDG